MYGSIGGGALLLIIIIVIVICCYCCKNSDDIIEERVPSIVEGAEFNPGERRDISEVIKTRKVNEEVASTLNDTK